MDVKFVSVLRDMVDTVPITDGQLVVCKDNDDLYYDMHETRYRVGAPMWLGLEDDFITPGFTMNDANVGVIQLVPNNGPDTVLQEGSPDNFVVGTAGELVSLTSLPELTRDGYKFLGWYEDEACQANKVDVFPAKFPHGKIRYYASWVKE